MFPGIATGGGGFQGSSTADGHLDVGALTVGGLTFAPKASESSLMTVGVVVLLALAAVHFFGRRG